MHVLSCVTCALVQSEPSHAGKVKPWIYVNRKGGNHDHQSQGQGASVPPHADGSRLLHNYLLRSITPPLRLCLELKSQGGGDRMANRYLGEIDLG